VVAKHSVMVTPVPDFALIRQKHSTVETYAALIGEEMRLARVNAKFSLRQLGDLTGVRFDLIQRFEAGKGVLAKAELDAIIGVLT